MFFTTKFASLIDDLTTLENSQSRRLSSKQMNSRHADVFYSKMACCIC